MAKSPTPGTASRNEQVLRARVGAHSATGSSTDPSAPLFRESDPATTAKPQGLEAQIVALPDPLRLRMSLVARQAASSDAALEPVLHLLVDGSPAKISAIAHAFRTNEPLREQWERTFEILRA